MYVYMYMCLYIYIYIYIYISGGLLGGGGPAGAPGQEGGHFFRYRYNYEYT